jgi:hypothetical protein
MAKAPDKLTARLDDVVSRRDKAERELAKLQATLARH